MKKIGVLFLSFILIGLVSASVYINEVELNNPGTDTEEYVELHNSGTSEINISGWMIEDGGSSIDFIPNGTLIPGFGFFVFEETISSLSLDNTNEIIKLKNSSGSIIDQTPSLTDNDNDNFTWQRAPDGIGSFIFKNQTKGVSNYYFNITNKSIITCAIKTEEVVLSAIINETYIDSVWFSYTINGNNSNQGAVYINDKYQATIPSSELIGGQNVTWNVYANDSTGREYNNSWKAFYIRNRTSLQIEPPSPDGQNNWYVTEPIFTLIPDSVGVNTYYMWDSTGALLYTAPFNLDDIPNPSKISAGILELNWWTDFGVCGNESTQTRILYIDLTDPVITNLQPANNSTVYTPYPDISAYLDELYAQNSGINLPSVLISIDNSPVPATTSLADGLDAIVNYTPQGDGLTEGKYNVTINVTDNAGRNSELTWTFEIKTPAHDLIVYSPENKMYNNKRVKFNITTSQEVEKIEYKDHNAKRPKWKRLCKNCDEYGFSRKRLKSFKEGENNITIRSQRAEEIKQQNIVFTIETKEPKISRTKPRKNSYTNGSEFYIKYTEENLQNITLFYDSSQTSKTNCESGRNKECIFGNINLTDYNNQLIEYWFEVKDPNNTVLSKKTIVKVDTTPPKINNITTIVDKRRINMQIDITEENLNKVQYKDLNSNNPRWRSLCRRLKDNVCEKKKTFKGETPNILIRVIDKAGNSDGGVVV